MQLIEYERDKSSSTRAGGIFKKRKAIAASVGGFLRFERKYRHFLRFEFDSLLSHGQVQIGRGRKAEINTVFGDQLKTVG
ncbi:MAG: hypothetical protein ACRD1I_05215 [Terriglobia bacterium]